MNVTGRSLSHTDFHLASIHVNTKRPAMAGRREA